MEKIKISAIQMCSKIGDKKSNIEKVKSLIERDVDSGTDIIILPEVWTVGWSPKHFQDSAEEIADEQIIRGLEECSFKNINMNKISQEQQTDNSYSSNPIFHYSSLKFLSSIAKSYSAWVIGGSIITKQSGKFYNTCPVFNREGELVTTYSKNHLFSYYGCDEGKYLEVGNSPVLVDIDGVKVGLTICYDIRFPEIYRAYRKAGADLLINCAAWGLKKPIPWECMTRSRAVENQTFMVALTQSGYIENDEWNIGHSRIIDYKGETISEIKDQKEGAMTAILEFAPMYEFREKCKCIDDIRKSYEVKTV